MTLLKGLWYLIILSKTEYRGNKMKFWQAMKALEEGRAVKPVNWDGHVKWRLENWNGTKIIKTDSWSPGIDFSVYLYQHLSDEWELYGEPEQLEKYEFAKKCYDQICKAVRELNDAGIKCAYPKDFEVNGELFEFQPPEQLLTFIQAVDGLKEGKIYRRKGWSNPEYTIKLFLPGVIKGNNASPWFPYPEDFEATDWIEVK